MAPTCATSSPSFKYRIGAGWAGTRGQPPPAWGQCSLSETHPPLPQLLPSGDRERKAGPVRSGPGGTEGQRGGPRPTAPSRGRARPGMPWTCQEACSRPPPPPQSCRPCAAPSRAPTPALSPQRAALQHSQPPAGFCPHRRISRPASLKSRRLNLRTRPRTSLAGAAARRGAGAGRRGRARQRAGPAGLEARIGTRGSPGAPWSRGRGGAGWGRREAGSRAEVTGHGTRGEPPSGARRLLGRRVSAPRVCAGRGAGADPAAATSGGVRSVPLGRGQSGSWAGEDLAGASSRCESRHLRARSST